MSNLSQAEQTAGISRKALATLQSAGNNGNRDPRDLPPVPATPPPRPTAFISPDLVPHNGKHEPTTEVISAQRATPIVDTPMRVIQVLESVSGRVLIRVTEWVESRDGSEMRADCTTIVLDYHEAASLARALARLEGDKPLVEAGKGKTTVRVRPLA